MIGNVVRVTVEAQTDSPPGGLTRRGAGLTAGALLGVSALLQAGAAVQRWGIAGPDEVGPDAAIEDHLFDYVIPADPWVSVGTAATLFGLAYLLIGAALVCLGFGARAIGGRITGVLATAMGAAAPFVLVGAHALVSGLSGVPSPVQYLIAGPGSLLFAVLQVIVVVLFAGFVAPRSWIWAIGVLLLLGVTVFGYIGAMLSVAPVLVGYQSYDTTPWTEGVLAANTAVAAVVICIGAFVSRPRPPLSQRRPLQPEAGYADVDPHEPVIAAREGEDAGEARQRVGLHRPEDS